MGPRVEVVETKPRLSPGSAGLRTRAHGGCTTVSALAEATGGIKSGNLVNSDKK